ncbi:unnamed protein product [Coregonus sp. 'balchen']|nr:unnamed protein product [Coregonus sp. 'balchen']
MSPTKITLIGAVLFALQQTQYLPIQKHHLMLLYTVFTVVNKTNMMLTGSSSSPFAPIESVVHRTFFAWPSPSTCTIFTSETKTPVVKKPSTDSSLTTKKGTGESLSGAAVPETSKTPWSPSKTAAHNRGKASQKKAKEQPENTETESCKKSD